MQFNTKVECIPEINNQLADTISRACIRFLCVNNVGVVGFYQSYKPIRQSHFNKNFNSSNLFPNFNWIKGKVQPYTGIRVRTSFKLAEEIQLTSSEKLILVQLTAIAETYIGKEESSQLDLSTLLGSIKDLNNLKQFQKLVKNHLIDLGLLSTRSTTTSSSSLCESELPDIDATFYTDNFASSSRQGCSNGNTFTKTQVIPALPLFEDTDYTDKEETLTDILNTSDSEEDTTNKNTIKEEHLETMTANSSYGFSLAVQVFDHYKQDRTLSQFIEELNIAFMLDNVVEDARKIAILHARTISHTRILFPVITPGTTFSAYVEECKRAVPDTLSEQTALNKYLHYTLSFDNFETSMRVFIRTADIALKDTIAVQKEISIKTKLMEMLIKDYDLWTCVRDSKLPMHSLIEELILRRQQNVARQKALHRNSSNKKPQLLYHQSNTNNINRNHKIKSEDDPGCGHCKISGHYADECYRKKNGLPPGDYRRKKYRVKTEVDTPPTSPTLDDKKVNFVADQVPDGLIKRAATLNQLPVTIMLDTGANCSVISPTLAQRLEIPDNGLSKVVLVGGASTLYKEIDIPLYLKMDGQELIIKDDCYISPNNLPGQDVILGNIHLKKLGAIIDTGNQTVHYKKPVLSLQFTLAANDKEKELRLQTLYRSKFPELCPKDEYDCGPSIGVAPKQDFTLIPAITPKWKFYYSPATPDEDYMISQLLKNDIIERSTAFEVLPKYMLMKRDSEGKPKTYQDPDGIERKKLRFVLDARRINERTRFMNYAPPTLLNIFAKMTCFTYASKLDLHNGFWQIQLPIQDRPHFSFIHKGKTYQFQRLVMGAKNSPMIFQRQMEQIFEDVLKEEDKARFLIYQDDLLLITEGSEDYHLHLLEKILQTMSNKKCRLNINKCELLRKELTFLSWKFDGTSASPSPQSVAKFINSKLPKTKGSLYATLQAYNYFRTAISDYTGRTKLLYQNSFGNKKDLVSWTPELKRQFEDLTNYLIQEPKIYLPKKEAEYILLTDASQNRLGGCLTQQDKQGRIFPIGFISIPLKPSKKNRSATYLEMLAIKKTLELFSPLLVGSTLKIKTDHRPLISLVESNTSPRFMDLLQSIMSYNITFQYIEGSTNNTADWLSRISTINHMILRERTSKPSLEKTTTKSLSEWQAMDSNVTNFDLDKENAQKFKKVEDLVVTNDLEEKPVIPNVPELHKIILKEIHDKNGHFATERLLKQVNRIFYWPQARKFITQYVKECIPCQRTNIIPEKSLKPPDTDSKEWKNTIKEWEVIAADCCGPLPITTRQNRHYLLLVDTYTKYIVAVAVENLESSTLNKQMDIILAYLGRFKVLRTDGAKYFTSEEFAKHLQQYEIELSIATPGNSRGNSYAERAIRTISTIITKMQLSLPGKEWDELLPLAVQSYNQSPGHEGIPQERLFKRTCYSNLYDILQIPNSQLKRIQEYQRHTTKKFEEQAPRTVYIKEKQTTKFQPPYSEPATLLSTDNTTAVIRKASKRIGIRKLRHLKGWRS